MLLDQNETNSAVSATHRLAHCVTSQTVCIYTIDPVVTRTNIVNFNDTTPYSNRLILLYVSSRLLLLASQFAYIWCQLNVSLTWLKFSIFCLVIAMCYENYVTCCRVLVSYLHQNLIPTTQLLILTPTGQNNLH